MRQTLILLILAGVFVTLVVQRAMVYRNSGYDTMPAALGEEAERALHLAAGGKYTSEDVAANGATVPSVAYRGFRARHDFNPAVGDRLCPVTRTKANPDCTWIVDGQPYQFCCPPCIDEFVRLAKERPESVQPAEAYVQD